MNFDRLRELILERAIQGKLVPQLESEPPVSQIECKYKNLPFKTPKKWGFANLADLIEFLDYGTSTKCHATKEVEDVPVLRMCNIENGTVNLENLKYANRDLIEISRPYLQYGDLIFNRTNSLELVGKCAPFLIDEKYSFASYLIRVRLKPTINAKYLSYWINSNICRQTQIYPKVSKQVGQANFSGSKLKQIVVPLPPIEEQLRIVFKIDDLFAKIKLLENSYRELQKLKEALRKLILQKAVQGKIVPQLESEPEVEQIGDDPEDVPFAIPEKWKWVNLHSTLKAISDGSHNPPPNVGHGVPVLSAKNVINGIIDTNSVTRWTTEEQWSIEDKKIHIQFGDVLLTIVGTIGRTAVVPNDCEKFMLQRSVCVMKPKECVNPEFLALILNSPSLFEWIMDHASGTAQKGIYLKTVKQIPIPLPSIEEQRRIVAKLNELLGSISQLEQTISTP